MLKFSEWDSMFEIGQSRRVGDLSWIPFRVSWLNRLRLHPPEVVSAALNIVMLAAGVPKEERGTVDVTRAELEVYTGARSEVIDKALSVLRARLVPTKRRKKREKVSVLPPVSSPSLVPSAQETPKKPPEAPRPLRGPGAAQRAEALASLWEEEEGKPAIRAMNPQRRARMAEFVKECGDSADLIRAAIKEFQSQPFHEKGSYGIDTLCRPSGRSRYIDLGHASLNGEKKTGGYEFIPPPGTGTEDD